MQGNRPTRWPSRGSLFSQLTRGSFRRTLTRVSFRAPLAAILPPPLFSLRVSASVGITREEKYKNYKKTTLRSLERAALFSGSEALWAPTPL